MKFKKIFFWICAINFLISGIVTEKALFESMELYKEPYYQVEAGKSDPWFKKTKVFFDGQKINMSNPSEFAEILKSTLSLCQKCKKESAVIDINEKYVCIESRFFAQNKKRVETLKAFADRKTLDDTKVWLLKVGDESYFFLLFYNKSRLELIPATNYKSVYQKLEKIAEAIQILSADINPSDFRIFINAQDDYTNMNFIIQRLSGQELNLNFDKYTSEIPDELRKQLLDLDEEKLKFLTQVKINQNADEARQVFEKKVKNILQESIKDAKNIFKQIPEKIRNKRIFPDQDSEEARFMQIRNHKPSLELFQSKIRGKLDAIFDEVNKIAMREQADTLQDQRKNKPEDKTNPNTSLPTSENPANPNTPKPKTGQNPCFEDKNSTNNQNKSQLPLFFKNWPFFIQSIIRAVISFWKKTTDVVFSWMQ